MNKKFFFKVTSSKNIGSGHIFRTLKIAKRLKKKDVIFITNNFNKNFNKFLKPYKTIVINNNENKFNKKKDLNSTIKILKKFKQKKILIVDNYFNKISWQKNIKNYVHKLIIIQDKLENNYCDIYINENFFFNKINKVFFKKKCLILCWPKYNLLSKKKIEIYKGNNIHCYIFFGGSDVKNYTYQILKIFSKSDIKFYVCLGESNNNINKVLKIKNKNIKIFKQGENYYKILKKCNFAISAGGSTLLDLIYNNMPLIAFCTANNQINNLINLKNNKSLFMYNKKINNEFIDYFYKCFKNRYKLNNNLIKNSKIDKVVNIIKNA